MTRPLTKFTDRFTETAIDDEVVVMSLNSGDFFSLTGTARTIWQLIDGTRNRDQLLEVLTDRYSGETESFAEDVDQFLLQLLEAGLLADS